VIKIWVLLTTVIYNITEHLKQQPTFLGLPFILFLELMLGTIF